MLNVLRIILGNFAVDIGLKNYLANVSSAAFIKRNQQDIESIISYIENNCSRCQHSMTTCDYLNPKQTINISQEEVFKMNFNLITQGRVKVCPQLKEKQK